MAFALRIGSHLCKRLWSRNLGHRKDVAILIHERAQARQECRQVRM